MKIRIKGNNIRFRLTQTEVKELSEHQKITCSTQFANGSFVYSIYGSKADLTKAQFAEGEIKISIPENRIRHWAASEELISMDDRLDSGKDEPLYILIEKDFKCLKDRPGEEESDMFPNPEENTLQC